jgi:hypothetical protein
MADGAVRDSKAPDFPLRRRWRSYFVHAPASGGVITEKGDRMTRIFSIVMVLALLLGARTSYAANTDASCTKDSTGAGSCFGSFTGFQGPRIGYVDFEMLGSIGLFSASYLGKSFSCRAAPGSEWLPAIQAATSGYRFYLQVRWDSTGNCTWVDVQNASWL